MKTTLRLSLAAGLAAALVACGGGNPGVPNPVPVLTEVPASARATIMAWTQFVASLMSSETSTPLTVGDAAAPTSETDAPVPVN
jgi:hypothetical protein